MPSFIGLWRKLSVPGLVLRLISLYGLYRVWMFGRLAWNEAHAAETPREAALYVHMWHGSLISLWETASVTAALWAAAWAFDIFKAEPRTGRKIFLASAWAGLCLLAAELPAAFLPRTVTYPGPVYIDFNSLAICAIATCVILAALQGRRLRAELEQFI